MTTLYHAARAFLIILFPICAVIVGVVGITRYPQESAIVLYVWAALALAWAAVMRRPR